MKDKLFKVGLIAVIIIGILAVVLCGELIGDIGYLFNWMGYTGLFCQIAEFVLGFVVAAGVLWAAIHGIRNKTASEEIPGQSNTRKKRIWGFLENILLCVIALVGFWICYDEVHNAVLDLMQPPITETVTVEKIEIFYTKKSRRKEVDFLRANGDRFYVKMPLYYDWTQHCGSLSTMDQTLSYPRTAELTYYPHSKTVAAIHIE